MGWRGLQLSELVFYEIHVGTFTSEGTFDAIIPRLRHLRDLGVSAIELMPLSQFPGERNWGYDGVFPFSVQNSYGGPLGLKRLVDACHNENLGVALDVVYNHLGPEGNYLADFGPYFTGHYRTPWGQAVNFDGEWSDEVRRFFTENSLYWIRDFHIDVLRLDAVHAIVDTSAKPFLRELNCFIQVAAADSTVRCTSSPSAIGTTFVPFDPPHEEATALLLSGMMIFITPCTQRSPEKMAGTTRISAVFHKLPGRLPPATSIKASIQNTDCVRTEVNLKG